MIIADADTLGVAEKPASGSNPTACSKARSAAGDRDVALDAIDDATRPLLVGLVFVADPRTRLLRSSTPNGSTWRVSRG